MVTRTSTLPFSQPSPPPASTNRGTTSVRNLERAGPISSLPSSREASIAEREPQQRRSCPEARGGAEGRRGTGRSKKARVWAGEGGGGGGGGPTLK